jgi:hypothetical protein
VPDRPLRIFLADGAPTGLLVAEIRIEGAGLVELPNERGRGPLRSSRPRARR